VSLLYLSLSPWSGDGAGTRETADGGRVLCLQVLIGSQRRGGGEEGGGGGGGGGEEGDGRRLRRSGGGRSQAEEAPSQSQRGEAGQVVVGGMLIPSGHVVCVFIRLNKTGEVEAEWDGRDGTGRDGHNPTPRFRAAAGQLTSPHLTSSLN
jgi:hypothetical protein